MGDFCFSYSPIWAADLWLLNATKKANYLLSTQYQYSHDLQDKFLDLVMKQQVLQSMVFYPSGMQLNSTKYTDQDHQNNKTNTMQACCMAKALTIKLIKLLWYDIAFRNKIKMFHTLKKKEYIENNPWAHIDMEFCV